VLKNKKLYEWVKRLIKIALIFIAIALLFFAFIPEKVKVDLISVEKGDLTVSVEGEGKTRIHDIYTIYTPMEGRVTRIESNAGDSVTAGKTIIANMYPANPIFLDKRSQIQAKANINGAESALELASSRVRQAQAQLTFDQSEYKRAQELFNSNMISTAALERAETQLTMQKAEKDTSIANRALMASRLKAAQAELLQPESTGDEASEACQICIYSPVNGYVLRILHKSERIIPAGTALVEIGDPKDLEVNIEMLSTNAVKVKTGDKAFIKRWGGIEDLAAIVTVIEPSGFTKISALGVEEQRVNVILSITAPYEKWKTLGDAFRVEAQIVIEEIKGVNKIPLSALFRQNGEWSVLKVIDGEVFLQAVLVGRRNNFFAEITQGLIVDEQIIMHPNNSIEVGMNVIQRL
jgi:HlyD family secretion protein